MNINTASTRPTSEGLLKCSTLRISEATPLSSKMRDSFFMVAYTCPAKALESTDGKHGPRAWACGLRGLQQARSGRREALLLTDLTVFPRWLGGKYPFVDGHSSAEGFSL